MVIILTMFYLKQREAILDKRINIEKAHVLLFKSVKAQQDFFSYETKNPDYFLSDNSTYLKRYHSEMDATTTLLNQIDFKTETQLDASIIKLQQDLKGIDSVFINLTDKVKQRGFKDFSLEGNMRKHAHWLENITELPTKDILSLRRHEKDYIIRNELSYVSKLENLVTSLQTQVANNNRISTVRKDSVLFHLNSYKDNFKTMVALDALIGIKDNTGLKKELDKRISTAESHFKTLLEDTNAWVDKAFFRLTIYFLVIGFLLLLFSVLISAYIAKRITQPLTDLTSHITRFVDSNFTLETEHPMVSTKDEIGSLTENFSYLKDEVINRLKFFKQKVDERTAELADANKRLVKLSEANSRFVPDEFLNNLNRRSIEEVVLGDHVEREMTIVFTDIRGFTQISEGLTPQENFDFINNYLNGIVPIIQKNGGFIDKFIGDSVMALFPKEADKAIQTVFEFEAFLQTLNVDLIAEGKTPITIGTGIHTGNLILGTIGHDNRLETTVISDAVNTAARVEGLSKYYNAKVICTEATIEPLKNKSDFKYRFVDNVKVKGKSQALAVYELLSPFDTEKISYLDDFNQAIEHIKNNNIKDANTIFKALHQKHPNDKAVAIFSERCHNFLDDNAETWDGITKMMTK